jgi:glycosyltransferase involved in cell wall biosynthesis
MIAAVLVTHNAERWLEETLTSVLAQSTTPDRIVIVDDHSTDRTRDVITDVLGDDATVLASNATTRDPSTRIAANFVQGVRAANADIVVLGDHDDVWLPERIAHQVDALERNPAVAMVASTATLIDENGRLLSGTLRGTFPVPATYSTWARPLQITYALTHSIATGGVSALRPAALAALDVPGGWLHDRWWSLRAVAHGRFLLDDGIVAHYRVTSGQQVGLQTANQGDPLWLVRQAGKGVGGLRRATQVTQLLLQSRNRGAD